MTDRRLVDPRTRAGCVTVCSMPGCDREREEPLPTIQPWFCHRCRVA